MSTTEGTETAEFDLSLDRLGGILDAPLSSLQRTGWWLRKTFFTRPRSRTDWVLVPLDKPSVRELLGRQYFEPGWETSYRYRREIINYRRIVYDDDRHPDFEWWQVHVRGYPHTPGAGDDATEVELAAHYEPEPIQHPDAHVSLDHIYIDRGMEPIVAILEGEGIDYEYVEVEGDEGG